MSSADRPASSIEFGRFTLLKQRRELLADGQRVEIGSRIFDLLMTLIEARGRVVSKDELMSRVWPGRIVGENNLQAGISALRKALGADRDLVRTVAGRGYQFAHEIREWAALQLPRRLTNLPAPISALLCREAALGEISSLVMDHRLLTLSGAGGIGKTRLAMESARGLLGRFPDGVWIADLAPLCDPDLVPASLAVALGMTSLDMRPEAIADSVGTKHILLVLDNCEHVIKVAARMAEELVRAGPKVFVLCTSREPLRVEGEWVYQVQPLDVPAEDALTLEEVLRTGAAKLFLMRACAAQPRFQADPSVAVSLGAICRRLDGMPLAIEFAAARAAVLGINEVALRLDNRFRLLTGGPRTALPRHQTLRATLDWSYELLAETDRQALCHLAVFAADFTLEAASAILSDGEVVASDVIDRVARLVEKSLLSVRTNGAVVCYRMLETTRAYALERLAERGELAQFARRHVQYHVMVFKRAMLEWRVRPLAEWSSDYCPMIDDARVALDWAFSAGGDLAVGAELTAALVPLWLQLSLMHEWAKRVEQALQVVLSSPKNDPRLEMQLSAALGAALIHTRGCEPEGDAAWSRALAIAKRMDDREYQLAALFGLYKRRLITPECREAHSLAQEFCRLAATQDDPSALHWGHVMMSHVLLVMGDQSAARRHLDSIVDRETAPRLRFPLLEHDFEARLIVLGPVLWFRGFPDQAARVAANAVDAAIDVGHLTNLCHVLGLLAWPIAILVGDWVQAQRCVKLLLDMPVPKALFYQSWARGLEAALLIKGGEVDRGVQALRAALAEHSKANSKLHEAILTVVLAEGLGVVGQVSGALAVIDEALAESNATEARWYMPEQLRIKGDLILLSDAPNAAAQADGCFAESLSWAHRQGALSWELRTATSLARLRQRQGLTAEALNVLQPVYARFTEGFHTADLLAANTLLGSLRGAGGSG
jgi:predicted ATPase/DNA-binding winged helix-turn-helix (wHTH) protein